MAGPEVELGKTSPTPPPEEEPKGARLAREWVERWQKRFGTPYRFVMGKDDRGAFELVEMGLSVEEILGIAEKAWGLNGKHPFEKKMAVALATFASQFNAIRLAVGVLEKEPKRPSLSEINRRQDQNGK